MKNKVIFLKWKENHIEDKIHNRKQQQKYPRNTIKQI